MAAILPWEAIRREYIEGQRDARGGVMYPTYEDLARKYTCSFTAIAQRGAREGWAELREQFQNRVVGQTTARAEQRATLIELDQAAIGAAARGIACIDALFERFGGQLRDKTRTKQQILSDFVDVEQLSRALRNFQEIGQTSRVVEEKRV